MKKNQGKPGPMLCIFTFFAEIGADLERERGQARMSHGERED